ncbi:hypothetical protein KCG44_10320 [Pacificimonas sp. WHA3]|uniref:Sulfotransferase family protein n=1 Tax=Pacificimonas pallii TaxID=2827236 RepID=A0ABS6SH07_9SPHN|nr:hypothetical protein [Pacificimonas pallii]MBV7257176.1 hypothetical protein [Pacificimonas pallii]
MAEPAEQLSDPDWFPYRYDFNQQRILFLKVPLAARQARTFLADTTLAENAPSAWLPISAMAATAGDPPATHFIFHSAFCRSTLMVKALDRAGGARGLSEPALMNDLAQEVRARGGSGTVTPLLSSLAAAFPGDGPMVIKPSNHANQAAPHLLRAAPGAKAVLLYAPLNDFLFSVVKKGLAGRVWARRLYAELSVYVPLELGLDGAGLFQLSDYHIAGLAWLLHQQHFASLMAQSGKERFLIVDSADFNAHRGETLAAVARHFDLPLDADAARALGDSDVFRSHAKESGDYAARVDAEKAHAKSPLLEEEIAGAADWTMRIAAQLPPTIPLPPHSV